MICKIARLSPKLSQSAVVLLPSLSLLFPLKTLTFLIHTDQLLSLFNYFLHSPTHHTHQFFCSFRIYFHHNWSTNRKTSPEIFLQKTWKFYFSSHICRLLCSKHPSTHHLQSFPTQTYLYLCTERKHKKILLLRVCKKFYMLTFFLTQRNICTSLRGVSPSRLLSISLNYLRK